MIQRPSRSHGYAAPGSPWWTLAKHPSLWRGCASKLSPLLGQNGGSTLLDSSGNVNEGTLTNMALATDWIQTAKGPALDLDGTDDQIVLSKTLLTSGEPFAISWWETINSDTGAYPDRFVFSINGTSLHLFILRIKSDANYRYLTWGKSPNAASSAIRATDVTPPASCIGVTKHFVIQGSDPISTTPSTFDIFEDAIPKTPSNTGAGFGTVTGDTIGFVGNNGADMQFHDLTVFNRKLSFNEVALLYNACRPGAMHEIEDDFPFVAPAAAPAGGGIRNPFGGPLSLRNPLGV